MKLETLNMEGNSRIGHFPDATVLKRGQVENLSYENDFLLLYHANKTHFHKKGFALGHVLRVRVFGTRKWPISHL